MTIGTILWATAIGYTIITMALEGFKRAKYAVLSRWVCLDTHRQLVTWFLLFLLRVSIAFYIGSWILL